MTATGRETQSHPVEYQLTRSGAVIRYEVLPDGRRRRLVEDEGQRGLLIEFNYEQIEMRLASLFSKR